MSTKTGDPVAAWTKWLAVISLILLAGSTVWEFLEVGATGWFWIDLALFLLFLGQLYYFVLSRPTRR